jgi:hypothetical protein
MAQIHPQALANVEAAHGLEKVISTSEPIEHLADGFGGALRCGSPDLARHRI